jgi:ABC-type phosphate transport system auxiliary subunit
LINTLKNLEKNIELKQGFKDLKDYEIRFIGHALESLRTERNKADYDGTSEISRKIAQDACEKVREIFSQISL